MRDEFPRLPKKCLSRFHLLLQTVRGSTNVANERPPYGKNSEAGFYMDRNAFVLALCEALVQF